MNKFFLTIIIALAATSAGAQSINTSWANLFEAAPPTMGSDMTLTADAIYYVLEGGTTASSGESGFPKEYDDPTLSIYYGGELMCTGAPYQGASFNNNLNIAKVNRQGQLQWVVYSTSGEMSDGRVATAPDGGIYVAMKVRHTDNMRTSDILITDATGSVATLNWRLESNDANRYQRGLLMKISQQGELQWMRTIDVSTAPQPAATGNYTNGTHDAIAIEDIVSDNQGNLYVAGRYSNPMSLYREDGQAITLSPHNTHGWNGDTQASRGDLFIAKFDNNGHILTTFTTGGCSGSESMTKLAWSGESLVFTSFVKGNSSSDYITVGNNSYPTPDANQGLLVCSLTKQLQPQWSAFYKGNKTNLNKTSVMQGNDLQVVGGSIIVNGMGNFCLDNGNGGTFKTQNSAREGFVIKLSASDGSWQAGTTSMAAFPTINPRGTQAPNTAINGWTGCFEARNDSLYVYGYNMSQQSVYLASLSSNDLKPGTMRHLIKGGSMPVAITCRAQGNMLYTMSRGRVYEDYNDDGEVSGYLQNFEYINSNILTTPIPKNEQGYFSSFCVPTAAFELPFEAKTEDGGRAGDVNGDGSVTSADVTALYNYLLDGDSSAIAAGDQDGDSHITSADVTAVYNIMLGN